MLGSPSQVRAFVLGTKTSYMVRGFKSPSQRTPLGPPDPTSPRPTPHLNLLPSRSSPPSTLRITGVGIWAYFPSAPVSGAPASTFPAIWHVHGVRGLRVGRSWPCTVRYDDPAAESPSSAGILSGCATACGDGSAPAMVPSRCPLQGSIRAGFATWFNYICRSSWPRAGESLQQGEPHGSGRGYNRHGHADALCRSH